MRRRGPRLRSLGELAEPLQLAERMVLHRSLLLGLLVACVVLLLDLGDRIPATAPAASALPPVQIIDVLAQTSLAERLALVRLEPGERVTAVQDRPVASDLLAGATAVGLDQGRGGYLDLTVEGVAGRRRVLILAH